MVSGIGGAGGGGKIGGVGKPAPDSVDGAAPKQRTERSFAEALDGAKPAGASSSAATSATPLERLRAGEIDLPTYLDTKVHEATAHLDGVLPPEEIEHLQDELRDLLAQDPDVAALGRGVQG